MPNKGQISELKNFASPPREIMPVIKLALLLMDSFAIPLNPKARNAIDTALKGKAAMPFKVNKYEGEMNWTIAKIELTGYRPPKVAQA